MIGFLELTSWACNRKILLNINSLHAIYERREYTVIDVGKNTDCRVKESYKEVYSKIAAMLDRERAKNV